VTIRRELGVLNAGKRGTSRETVLMTWKSAPVLNAVTRAIFRKIVRMSVVAEFLVVVTSRREDATIVVKRDTFQATAQEAIAELAAEHATAAVRQATSQEIVPEMGRMEAIKGPASIVEVLIISLETARISAAAAAEEAAVISGRKHVLIAERKVTCPETARGLRNQGQ